MTTVAGGATVPGVLSTVTDHDVHVSLLAMHVATAVCLAALFLAFLVWSTNRQAVLTTQEPEPAEDDQEWAVVESPPGWPGQPVTLRVPAVYASDVHFIHLPHPRPFDWATDDKELTT